MAWHVGNGGVYRQPVVQRAVPVALPFPPVVNITASGGITVAATQLSGAALEKFAATGNLQVAATQLSGAALEKFTSTGNLNVAPVQLSGAALEKFAATGNLQVAATQLSGAALEKFAASGGVTLTPVVLSGAALEKFQASGALTTHPVVMGPANEWRARAVRQAKLSTTGLQTFSTPTLGAVPKAAILIHNRANDGNPRSDAITAIGFTDGTASRSVGISVDDNENPSDTRRATGNTLLAVPSGVSDSVATVAAFSRFLQDKLEVNWTSATADTEFITAILMGGAGFQAAVVGVSAADTQGNTVSITGLAFAPDQLLVISGQQSFGSPEAAAGSAISIGWASRGSGTAVQYQGSYAVAHRDNLSGSSSAVAANSDTVVARRLTADTSGNAVLGAGYRVTQFTGDGAVIETITADEGESLAVLALYYGGARPWAGRVDAPTSATTQNIETPDHAPELILALVSGNDGAMNSGLRSDDAGVFGLGVSTPDAQIANSVSVEDAVTPSQSRSRSDGSSFVRAIRDPSGELVGTRAVDRFGFDVTWSSVFSVAAHVWYMGPQVTLNARVRDFAATGNLQRPPTVLSGAALERFTSTGSIVLGAVVLSGSATVVVALTASGGITLSPVALSGAALEKFAASGALQTGAVVLSGSALEKFAATGNLQRPATQLSGAALEKFAASGNLAAAAAMLAASGTIKFSATGALTTGSITLSGAALERFVATGQITLPAAILLGSDAELVQDIIVLQAGRQALLALLAGRDGLLDLDAGRDAVYDLKGSF